MNAAPETTSTSTQIHGAMCGTSGTSAARTPSLT